MFGRAMSRTGRQRADGGVVLFDERGEFYITLMQAGRRLIECFRIGIRCEANRSRKGERECARRKKIEQAGHGEMFPIRALVASDIWLKYAEMRLLLPTRAHRPHAYQSCAKSQLAHISLDRA